MYRLCRCSNNYFSKLMQVMDEDCHNPCDRKTSDTCQMYLQLFKTRNTSRLNFV